jgi:hypothetical protein
VSLTFDPERSVDQHECADCGTPYRLVRGQLTWSGEPHALFFAACHNHDDSRDVLIDVVLDWTGDAAITFGCRVGPAEGEDDPVATLVEAAESYEDDPQWGTKLTRTQALADPRLPEFWDVVDYVLIHDPTIRPHVYGID